LVRVVVETRRPPRAGQATAGSSFGRAAAAIDAAASSDETASERDYDDDPQDFYVHDHMYDAGFDPHADQGGAGAKYKLLGSGNALALGLGLDVLRGNGYGMVDNLVQR
jgi:hypothetical protein